MPSGRSPSFVEEQLQAKPKENREDREEEVRKIRQQIEAVEAEQLATEQLEAEQLEAEQLPGKVNTGCAEIIKKEEKNGEDPYTNINIGPKENVREFKYHVNKCRYFNDKIYKNIEQEDQKFTNIKQLKWKDVIKFLLYMILISKRWTKDYKLDFNSLRLMNSQIFDNNYMFSQIVNELQLFNIYSKYIIRDKSSDEKKKKLEDLSNLFNIIDEKLAEEKDEKLKDILKIIKAKFNKAERQYNKKRNEIQSGIYGLLYQLYTKKENFDDNKIMINIRQKWADFGYETIIYDIDNEYKSSNIDSELNDLFGDGIVSTREIKNIREFYLIERKGDLDLSDHAENETSTTYKRSDGKFFTLDDRKNNTKMHQFKLYNWLKILEFTGDNHLFDRSRDFIGGLFTKDKCDIDDNKFKYYLNSEYVHNKITELYQDIKENYGLKKVGLNNIVFELSLKSGKKQKEVRSLVKDIYNKLKEIIKQTIAARVIPNIYIKISNLLNDIKCDEITDKDKCNQEKGSRCHFDEIDDKCHNVQDIINSENGHLRFIDNTIFDNINEYSVIKGQRGYKKYQEKKRLMEGKFVKIIKVNPLDGGNSAIEINNKFEFSGAEILNLDTKIYEYIEKLDSKYKELDELGSLKSSPLINEFEFYLVQLIQYIHSKRRTQKTGEIYSKFYNNFYKKFKTGKKNPLYFEIKGVAFSEPGFKIWARERNNYFKFLLENDHEKYEGSLDEFNMIHNFIIKGKGDADKFIKKINDFLINYLEDLKKSKAIVYTGKMNNQSIISFRGENVTPIELNYKTFEKFIENLIKSSSAKDGVMNIFSDDFYNDHEEIIKIENEQNAEKKQELQLKISEAQKAEEAARAAQVKLEAVNVGDTEGRKKAEREAIEATERAEKAERAASKFASAHRRRRAAEEEEKKQASAIKVAATDAQTRNFELEVELLTLKDQMSEAEKISEENEQLRNDLKAERERARLIEEELNRRFSVQTDTEARAAEARAERERAAQAAEAAAQAAAQAEAQADAQVEEGFAESIAAGSPLRKQRDTEAARRRARTKAGEKKPKQKTVQQKMKSWLLPGEILKLGILLKDIGGYKREQLVEIIRMRQIQGELVIDYLYDGDRDWTTQIPVDEKDIQLVPVDDSLRRHYSFTEFKDALSRRKQSIPNLNDYYTWIDTGG